MSVFIVFSGLDCSGKSTQIGLLKNEFKARRAKIFVFWSRGGYTPGFQLIKDLIRKVGKHKLPDPGFSEQRQKALANPVILKIWLTIAICDLLFYYAIYLRLKYYFGCSIICDRYLMDTNIDFKLSYPEQKTESWILWRILNLVACKPDFHFVSTVPVTESMRRSKFKFEPFPDSEETLGKRLELYNKSVNNSTELIPINGMDDIATIKEFINNIVLVGK